VSIVSPAFIAALIFVTLGAWALWRRMRRRRRGQATTGVALLAAALTVVCGLSVANAYFRYLPHLGDVTNVVADERNWPDFTTVRAVSPADAERRWPHGVTVHLDVPDRGSGFGPTSALVYLPTQYFSAPSERFPVVYLFHGSPGVPGDWFRGGRAAQAATTMAADGRPVIIVSPRMSSGWLDDPECVNGVKEKVETHLLDDVLPAVDGTLRTVASRDGRTFGGMSAGGYCALNMGLRHRDLVGTIIDMSGFTRPTYTGGLAKLFGPLTPAVRAQISANTPADYAATLSAAPPTRVWLDSGSSDKEVLGEMTPIAATLRSRGLDVEFRVRTGAHTFGVWAPALTEALPWSQGLPAGVSSGNPSRPGPVVAVVRAR
jgi:enterochelin esterase-like enzyme